MAHPISTDYKDDEIALARFAKALGHPARIAIMKHLMTFMLLLIKFEQI